MTYSYNPQRAAAVFVDGITTAVFKGLTPDISWKSYCARLSERRPELYFEYLEQPHDWREILTGRAVPYADLVEAMTRDGSAGVPDSTQFVAVFGYSMGGLSALRVAHALSELERSQLKYLALVTLGTPFCGTGRLLDPLFRRVQIDYIQSMMAEEENRTLLEELLERTSAMQCRILLGEIERDEMVSASSSLLPAHWLSERPGRPNLRWGTFRITSGKLIRAHDGLLSDELAVGFIDGLLDGLLPDSA